MTRIHNIIILGLTPVLSAPVLAQTSSDSSQIFGGTLGVQTQLSDNARKAETNELEERQDSISASVTADWQGGWASATADYRLNHQNYAEDSQENRNTLEGNAELQLGRDSDPVDLIIKHSQRSQYNSPAAAEISDNLDDRQIYSVIPSAKWAISTVDRLVLQGNFDDVRFKEESFKDSERRGGMVYWNHRFSNTDSLQVTAGTTEVEYKSSALDSYSSDYAHLTYSAQLRSLSYSLMAGVTEAQFADGDDDYQAPTYRGNLIYQAGAQTFSVTAYQEITDSSYGAGNTDDLVPGADNDGVGVDQIERQFVSADWQSDSLCGRCSFKLFVHLRNDDYRRLAEDGTQRVVGSSLAYRISEYMTLSGRVSRGREAFDSPSKTDFDRDSAGLQLEGKIAASASAALFYTFEQRAYVDGGSKYDVNAIGVSLNYTF